ncbi:MAG: glycosyltransferase [Flavipsychrobacter sp.]
MSAAKVLFIVPYPVRHAPSQRFRVELFEPELQAAEVDYSISPFMDEATWNVLYKNGSILQKAVGIIKGYLKRFKTVLLDVPKYDYIFIHREAAPLGPPIFEWLIAKVLRKKIIFDFDDAIWMENTSNENKLAALLKAAWKTKSICKWSYKVAGGNDYLCNFAKQHNDSVVLLPTCVDMQRMHKGEKQHHEGQVTIGWTGSHSTLKYLDDVIEVLQELEEKHNTRFIVIANKQPDLPLKNLEFIKWSEETEVADLLKIDIGIMPLKADAWSEGKCGFKLIQYLSLGIPAVANPVGVNKVIIEEGVNGYLCNSPEEWVTALTSLVADANLRRSFGQSGKEKMASNYSIASQKDTFLQLFS